MGLDSIFNEKRLGGGRRTTQPPPHSDPYRKPFSLDYRQPIKTINGHFQTICGLRMPDEFYTQGTNTLHMGAPGSGKSLLAKARMNSFLRHGREKRLLGLFDVKGDGRGIGKALAREHNVPFHYLNVSDPDADALDIQALLKGDPIRIGRMAAEFIPTDPNDPVWSLSGQLLMKAAIYVLEMSGQRYGFHDIFNCCSATAESFAQFLLVNPNNQPTVQRILQSSNTKGVDSVLSNLQAKIESMRLPAVHQFYSNRSRWFNLDDALEQGGVLVIAQDVHAVSASQAMSRFVFSSLVDEILTEPDFSQPHRLLVIDELYAVGKKLPKLTEGISQGRSKRLSLDMALQSYAQAQEILGKEGADIMLNTCSFLSLMRVRGNDAQQFAQWTGSINTWKKGYSFDHQGNPSRSYSVASDKRIEEDFFRFGAGAYPGQSLDFVSISDDLNVQKVSLPWNQVMQMQPPSIAVRRRRRPIGQMHLPLWNPVEHQKKLNTAARTQLADMFAQESAHLPADQRLYASVMAQFIRSDVFNNASAAFNSVKKKLSH